MHARMLLNSEILTYHISNGNSRISLLLMVQEGLTLQQRLKRDCDSLYDNIHSMMRNIVLGLIVINKTRERTTSDFFNLNGCKTVKDSSNISYLQQKTVTQLLTRTL